MSHLQLTFLSTINPKQSLLLIPTGDATKEKRELHFDPWSCRCGTKNGLFLTLRWSGWLPEWKVLTKYRTLGASHWSTIVSHEIPSPTQARAGEGGLVGALVGGVWGGIHSKQRGSSFWRVCCIFGLLVSCHHHCRQQHDNLSLWSCFWHCLQVSWINCWILPQGVFYVSSSTKALWSILSTASSCLPFPCSHSWSAL